MSVGEIRHDEPSHELVVHGPGKPGGRTRLIEQIKKSNLIKGHAIARTSLIYLREGNSNH